MQSRDHWNRVYTTKTPTGVSWFQEHALQSVALIRQAGLSKDAAIIDVGGGASTLVDDLVAEHYRNVTVLDLSDAALAAAQTRLAERAGDVTWIAGDITQVELPVRAYDVWHDRAVFHFLTTSEQRQAYVAKALKALRPGGFAIVGTFGPNGPEKCSGLPVMRYSADTLHNTFGARFTLVEHSIDVHTTPWDAAQEFTYCFCRREH